MDTISPFSISNKIIYGEVCDTEKLLAKNVDHNGLCVGNRFVNFSSENITVLFRDGTFSHIPPKLNPPYFDALVICHNKSNNLSPINIIDGDEDNFTKHIRIQLARANNRDLYWEEIIKIDVIRDTRKGVYLKSCDVNVALTSRLSYVDYHPFSLQHTINKYIKSEDFDPMYDIGVQVRLINNDTKTHILYVIFNNKISCIKGKPSNIQKDGVYITGLVELETTTANSIRKDVWYSLDDVLEGKCPIRMFEHLAEAKNYLNESKNNIILEKNLERDHELLLAREKRSRETIELEVSKLKAELLKEKTILEEKERIAEKEINALKQEAERKIQQEKDRAAIRSANIKMYTDLIKVVGVLATVGFGIYKLANTGK